MPPAGPLTTADGGRAPPPASGGGSCSAPPTYCGANTSAWPGWNRSTRANRSAMRARTSTRSCSCSSTSAGGRPRSTATSSTCLRRRCSWLWKEPMGVAVGITPWNYPMMMATQKLAPALAAGCTFILKPPEQTPLTCLELPKILEEAGLPAGVFHVLTGFGETAGAPLVAHPGVDKVGFTGSREVGKLIMRSGADTLKRVTLELGGKSPNIVFADADFESAVEGSANGVFWNQGEICSAGTRVFVEHAIYDDAVNELSNRATSLVLGDPAGEDTTMGPLVSKEQQERVERYLEIGAGEARVAAQGSTPTDPALANGYFVPPTIFADVRNDARIAREEIFGPVMSVIPFGAIEDVLTMANDNDYGLAAAIWTKDIKKAMRAAQALRAGIVWINDTQPAPTEMPWGGYKQSGVGRELGKHGLDDYLEEKAVYVNLAD